MVLVDTMAWTRSSQDNLDRYANVSEDGGWAWDAIKPYFKKVWAFYLDSKLHYAHIGFLE